MTSSATAAPSGARIWPRVLLSAALAAGFGWTLHAGGLPLLPTRERLGRIGWGPVAIYAGWFSLLWVVRAHRWTYLLRPLAKVPRRDVLAIGLTGAAAIVLAPLRLGELARPYLIAGRGVTFAQALGTVGAERIVDGIVLALMLTGGLLFAVPLSPLPDHLGDLPLPVAAIPRAAWLSLAIFGAAALAMVGFYFARAPAERLTASVVGAVSPRAAAALGRTVARVAEGLSFLPRPRDALPFVRDTLVYWGMNVTGILFLLRAAGFQASLAQATVLLGVISLGLLMPSGPGFFGAFQLSAYCGLALYFSLDQVVQEGAAFVFALYVLQTSVAVSFGVLGLSLMPARKPPPIPN